MTATIDAAGRVVIPKALRERAGLTAGTRVDFRFHEGTIEITPADGEVDWETRHGIRFPLPAGHGPELSIEDVRGVIDDVRGDRSDKAARAGR